MEFINSLNDALWSYVITIVLVGAVRRFVIFTNLPALPDALALIFKDAFGIEQVSGGAVGAAVLQGVKRGLFSNEAGEGSAPNAAAIADTSHPVKQGLVQALGVFVDTLLICSCTAFIIILSGQLGCGEDGIILTSISLEAAVGPLGKYFITAAIFLFAFSSIIGNYYYGETNVRFLLQSKPSGAEKAGVFAYRVISFFVVLLGAFVSLQTAWSFVDISMGILTLINVVAITMLSGKVFRLLKDYSDQRKRGIADPVFDKSRTRVEDPDKLEGWA